MIYIISITVGILLAAILSTADESTEWLEEFFHYLTLIFGSLFGTVLFVEILKVQQRAEFSWLEAVLWSLIGALLARLAVQFFKTRKRKRIFDQVTAHEFIIKKSNKTTRGGDFK